VSKTFSAGLVRLTSIIKPGGPLPVSRSTWWAGVKSGRFPAPVKLGPRITAWRSADIQRLIDGGFDASSPAMKLASENYNSDVEGSS
jgi:prophage regulatory protein